MEAPLEREFKAASHVRLYLLAILACVVVGFLGTTIGMISGAVSGAVMASAFVALPLVFCVFLAVRDSATTPSVIVSDRGLERSNVDRTVVIRWRNIAALDIVHDGTARIRYLTSDRLEQLVADRITRAGGTPAQLSKTNGAVTARDATRDATRGNGAPPSDEAGDTPPTLEEFDIERVMRIELDIIGDLGTHGEELPEIPPSRAGEATLVWDALLTHYAGERYKGIHAA
ncbi:hypothetical protein GCM10011490_08260 [Pseudoclavibacter endophyticus]|uniref:PH domain-containing protein n=1 Tax=Pseudoclavibacter endophyticus TaxID=1778590 RepID=A0A6H9WFM6_9MICO|nr:hypothetical protein [Pseudoclavibacter endophyticus]KAB1649702.1 hypothetical protein F8O04_05550 [Pseudoclavibacter endophyticus]GGA60436.1 hypothetical protein GCM10011490_08260 [Pseudoclavibacter endophyticus]